MPRTNQKWRGAPKESRDKAGLGVSRKRSRCLSLDRRRNGKSEEFLAKLGKAEAAKQHGSASAAGCANQEPLSLAARTSSLAVERFLTIFRFLWSGLTLGFYPRRLFLLRTLHQRARAKSKLLQCVMIMRCKQNTQIRDAQCNSRSRTSFGAKNVIALLDA